MDDRDDKIDPQETINPTDPVDATHTEAANSGGHLQSAPIPPQNSRDAYPPSLNHKEYDANPPYSGSKLDFHLSFWPTLALPYILPFFLDFVAGQFHNTEWGRILRSTTLLPSFLVIAIAVLLRFLLEKKNHYLAKGFMWAVICATAIPLIIFSLMFGSCLLMGI